MPYESGLLSIDDITVNGLKDYEVGLGYDGLSAASRFNGLEAPKPEVGGTIKQDGNVYVAISAHDIARKMDLGVNLKAAYLGADVAVGANLVRAFEASETSVTIVANIWQRVDNLNLEGQKIDLNGDAKAALDEGDEAFHKSYGGYYCHTVHRGGRLYVAYHVKMTTRKAAKDLAAYVEANFKDLAKLAAGLKTHLEDTKESYSWEIHIEKIGAGGALPDWDKDDPEAASEMIREYIDKFLADTEANPLPYDGDYRGYWIIPSVKADGLRQAVIEADGKVDALSDWAEAYVDVMGEVRGILDPNSKEGYAVDTASRDRLSDIFTEAENDLEAIRTAYGNMLHFSEYKSPETLKEDGVLKSTPSETLEEIKGIRTQVLTQICVGQNVRMSFPDSGWWIWKSADSMPADAEEDPNESWPYVRLSKTESQPYTIVSSDKAVGEPVRHGDVIRFQSTEATEKNKQIYMPVSGWYVKMATYEGGEDYKYEWVVDIEGAADGQVLTNSVLSKIKNQDRNDVFWFPKNEYLGETNNDNDDWHLKIQRA